MKGGDLSEKLFSIIPKMGTVKISQKEYKFKKCFLSESEDEVESNATPDL